ncbi:VOC family protein [Streptosporangium lutulentum]|uniref:VOC family protein n=1 Tax=Streptosporangium lutulentum TaxID=1461250 RepID=UPI0027D8B55F|nr:VOC family protein [Streptosporangium lutulentum]
MRASFRAQTLAAGYVQPSTTGTPRTPTSGLDLAAERWGRRPNQAGGRHPPIGGSRPGRGERGKRRDRSLRERGRTRKRRRTRRQLHIDVRVEDLEQAEQKALALGARRLRGGGERFRVYEDLVGHPFCLVSW